MSITLDLKSVQLLAINLALCAKAGDRLYLQGTLGTGKTTFARAFLKALGFVGNVKSPTYTWIDLYPLKHLSVAHFDLYRLNSAADWHDLGLVEYLSPPWVSLVEWPEQTKLPTPMVSISLAYSLKSDDWREVSVTGGNPRGVAWLAQSNK